MYNRIVTTKADEAILKENERRIKVGMQEMTPYKEQLQFEGKLYSLTDEKSKELVSLLYVGLEQEFGIDRQAPEPTKPVEEKPAFDKALESVKQEKGVVSSTTTTVPSEGISTGSDGDLKDISATSNDESPADITITVFECDHPGCDFETGAKIALAGHKRSHKKKEATSKISK